MENCKQITGLLWGSKLLDIVENSYARMLGPEASVDEVKVCIAECGDVFIKLLFKGGVGKKGTSGLIGRAKDVVNTREEKRSFV